MIVNSTSISVCEVWEVRAEIQVSRRKFHTYIHLDYVIVEFLSCNKKKNIYIYIYIYNDLAKK